MDEDRVEGAGRQVKGSVKEGVGGFSGAKVQDAADSVTNATTE